MKYLISAMVLLLYSLLAWNSPMHNQIRTSTLSLNTRTFPNVCVQSYTLNRKKNCLLLLSSVSSRSFWSTFFYVRSQLLRSSRKPKISIANLFQFEIRNCIKSFVSHRRSSTALFIDDWLDCANGEKNVVT